MQYCVKKKIGKREHRNIVAENFDVCDLALLTSMVAAKVTAEVAANITAKIATNIIAIERMETKLQV
jgi:hypothetical protein